MNTQPHNHIVKSHDEERRILLDEILRMGEMAAAQLEAALDVIDRRDGKAAERIVANDEAIDALELQVSHDAMKLALRGPLARDLREILAGTYQYAFERGEIPPTRIVQQSLEH